MGTLMNLDGDLGMCLKYNPIDGITDETVRDLCAAILGKNDGAKWGWVVLLRDGRVAGIVGGCCYTGWEARSEAVGEIHETASAAAEWVAHDLAHRDDCRRKSDEPELLASLTRQLLGTEPIPTRTGRFE